MYLTIEQVAELLNVKESWIYARTGSGEKRGAGRGRKSKKQHEVKPARPMEIVPHFKAGRLLRFDKAEVLEWWGKLHRGPQSSVQQTEAAQQAAEKAAIN